MGNEQGKVLDTTTPEGVRAMDENLQRKFAKGIQYNMKVVVRGDRNTGKSCLLYRMQGKSFSDNYIPTNEIQVGHILWTYPGTSDTVKVEIWDTVDKGRPQKSASKGLKIFNPKEDKDQSEPVLDAEFLDVYKGAHAVVLMYDVVKQWTWQYVERHVNHIPYHIPILILGNFSDMSEHRNTSYEDAEFYITHLNRPEGAADIRYAECSMKNGFGLQYLHKFLSIPFLQMQQESLLHQLKTNREQILVIQEELDGYQTSSSYDQFKQKAEEQVAPPPSKPQDPPTKPHPSPTIVDASKELESTDGSTPENEVPSVGRKLSSKFSGFLSRNKKSPKQTKNQQPSPRTPKSPLDKKRGVKNVDEFVPEDELDDQFFNDDENGVEHSREESGLQSDDDDDDDYNPKVAMDEDLSSLDEEEEVISTEMNSRQQKQQKQQQQLQQQQQQEEDEDEEEEESEEEPLDDINGHIVDPVMLQPTIVNIASVSPPKPKQQQQQKQQQQKQQTPKKPLKSLQDVVLTESEEDSEQEEEVTKGIVKVVKPKATSEEKETTKSLSSRKPSGGLLLAFNETTPTKQKIKKKKSESEPTDSVPSEKRKKDRRRSSDGREKKHKRKSKHEKDEELEKNSSTAVTADNDPFGFTTSLDAWLGADDESPSLKSRSTHSVSKKLMDSLNEEEDGIEEKPKKSKKKRKSKKESGTNFNELL